MADAWTQIVELQLENNALRARLEAIKSIAAVACRANRGHDDHEALEEILELADR